MTEAVEERANTVRTTDRTSLTMDERIGSLFQPEATATTSWKSPYGMDNRDSHRQRQLEQDQRKLDRLQTEQQLNQIQREQNQSRQQGADQREFQRQQQMNRLKDQQRTPQIKRRR